MSRKKEPEPPPVDPSTMTDDELIAYHAAEKARFAASLRENLAKFGTTLGPAATAPAVPLAQKSDPAMVPARPRSVKFEVMRLNGRALESNPKWKDVRKTCPHCGKTKLVVPDFGIVVRRDWEYAMSWCRDCRGKTNYRKQERRYRTKNGKPGEER